MAVRNKKRLEEALRAEDYVYGKPTPQYTDERWKRESQYAAYDVNDDYTQKAMDDLKAGNFPGSALNERIHNEKVKLGYGGQFKPSYIFNYNPSENQKKAEDVRERLAMYDKFDYDPSEDAAYKALTNIYHNNAKAASENALARAAAANGGRLSSNAIIAANLGYQDKMAGLEAEIPQLRQAAYNMFRDEKNDLRQLGYDYANAEKENYGRWVDDYNRLYTGTMDRLRNEYDLSKGLGYVTYNLGQMTGITPGVPWASEVNAATQNAITLSQNLGYVTGSLSALTGIPEGTPFESAKQYLTNLQASVQSDMGYYSREWLDKNNMPYVKEGPTLSREQLEATKQNNVMDYNLGKYKVDANNGQYNPYENQNNGVDGETEPTINPDEVAEPTSDQKVKDALAMVQGSANPVDEVLKLIKKGKLKLTDEELTLLYSMM